MKSSLHHGDSVDSIFSSKGLNPDPSLEYGESSSLDTSVEGSTLKTLNQEGVYQLTRHCRTFSEVLNLLKEVFIDVGNSYNSSLRVMAHERLGELLQILRLVINSYPEIESFDVLASAAQLITHVKEYKYEDENPTVNPEIFRSINSLAMVFSSSVSEYLMEDESNSSPLMVSSPYFETMDPAETPGHIESNEFSTGMPDVPDGTQMEGNIDDYLLQLDCGLERALDRAKVLSKYLGELIMYIKKKAHIETEYVRNIMKLTQQTKSALSEHSFLPFQSLYCTNLDNEKEFASNCQAVYQKLNNKFAESLQAKKNEHDKKRKLIRETWARERKRSEEIVLFLKKAKLNYKNKVQEFHKAKEAAIKAEEEQQVASSQQTPKVGGGTTALAAALTGSAAGKADKKKKQEEDASIKAMKAEQTYRTYIAEANKSVQELETFKARYLQQLREVMLQCDQTAKSATLTFFQLHHQLFAPLPVQFQAMHEDAKRYEPGFQYAEYVRSLHLQSTQAKVEFRFEPYPSNGSSFFGRGLSDTESSSSRSYDDLSPLGTDHSRVNIMRRHSTEDSLSSDDVLDDGPMKEGKITSFAASGSAGDTGFESSPAQLRNLTKNAFKVAGHVKGAFKSKKSHKSTFFGVDFCASCQGAVDGVPFLVKKCVAEIDNRALTTKGIYRKNGVKNRVQKICALFDSQSDRVDLSECTPYDVTGALKYFLRQLPEPLLPFHLYDAFVDVGKECNQFMNAAHETLGSETEERPLPVEPFVGRLRDAVDQLRVENRNTLQWIVAHLSRVAEHSQHNKMNASNLAIVFGPTLLRPTADGNEAYEDIHDQHRVVELLIVHKDLVFDVHPQANEDVPHQPDSSQSRPSLTDGPEQIATTDDHVRSKRDSTSMRKSQSFEVDKTQATPTDGGRSFFPSSASVKDVNSPSQCTDTSTPLGTDQPASNSCVHDEETFGSMTSLPVYNSRRVAVSDVTAPSLADLEIPPPLPTRRRKKSRKTSEDFGSASAKASPLPSPGKEHSNSFNSGIGKLGSLARRFSSEILLSAHHSQRSAEEKSLDPPKSIAPNHNNNHPPDRRNPSAVLLLQGSSLDSDDTDSKSASFC